MKLNSNLLGNSKSYVNGDWVSAQSGKTFEIFNPANCELICTVPDMVGEDCELAIVGAAKSFEMWSSTTAKVRAKNIFLNSKIRVG